MHFIQFENSMLTNIPLIDNQHKIFISKINDLHLAMNDGFGSKTIKDTLRFLQVYASKHFSEEEQLMEQYNCPVKEINKKAHKIFVDKLQIFEKKLTDESLFLTLDVYKELFNWFVNHIQTIDQKMSDYVK